MTNSQGGPKRPRGGKPPKPKTHDWNALKAEFLSGQETLNEFRIRHKMGASWFYMKAADWAEARDRIGKEAVKKAEGKLADYYGSYIEQTRKLLASINNQIAAALQQTIIVDEKSGERKIAPMDADKLSSMSHAISANVKTLRLIEGKSTENKAVKVEGDLNDRLTGLIEAMEADGEDTLGDVRT